MSKFYKNILLVLVILFLLALVVSSAYQNGQSEQSQALSQVASEIQAGKVTSISVNGSALDVTLSNGQHISSEKEIESSLTDTLKNYGVTPDELSKVSIQVQDQSSFNFWVGTLAPTLLSTLIIIGIFWYLMRQARGGMNQAFTFGRANLKPFTNFKERVTFADVAGLQEAKQELSEVVGFMKNPQKYLDIGATVPRGVLLMGQPGTGKTLLARAVAGEANVPFFHISASEFVEMFVGVGASRVRDVFQTAKRAAPSIIFIDEIDAVGRERGAGLGGGHDEREQTLNQILVEMDGFDRETNVIVMAATNRADVLDPALLRPGRFDRRVFLDLPDINEREAILKMHAKNKPLAKDIDLRKVATRTPGFSGADLANLVNEAAILTVKNGKDKIAQQYFYESIEKVMLGPERKSRLISDREKELTAYHEAGHALVAAGLKDSDPVHKVSVVSRGQIGGYTLKLPLEDQRLRTKSQFLADIAVALGGHAAEKIVFNDITTGASNDLTVASETARMLVTKYGMSEKMGPMTFGKTQEMIFLGREISTEKNYSEEVAEQIDQEVKKFIDRAYRTAEKILTSYRPALNRVAKALIEHETLEQDEFYALVKEFDLKPISV
ncbi:MAG: ATP-dependent zinc metalloprotease FtsH [Patescibacteria group bacterium]|nr:ATP-dependent zinc metalloprotease FtsH [Patescibacteria group bacterium]MCL5224101.1 ATP-dependent zinc metalloprotease FtsH [Patescibacteria group bacterium]